MDKICDNCKFFDRDATIHETGCCRHHSPTIIITDENTSFGIFPKTFYDDWCGEWQKIVEPK